MKKILKIKWDNYPEHDIQIDGNGYVGYCLTHNEYVSQNKRCSQFPCQTAMWSDLWKTELKISPQQK